MPRKPDEGAPSQGAELMSDETRKEVFGGSGPHQGPGAREEGDEEQRHDSGASESGSGERVGQVKKTK